MNTFRHLLFLTALALVLTVQAGCDSSDPDADEQGPAVGRYTLRMDGGLPGASSGTAVFAEISADDEDGPGFIIMLSGVNSARDTIAISMYRASARPGAGTYRFGKTEEGLSSEHFALMALSLEISSETGAGGYAIGSTSGTLKLLESSSSRVSGTFTVEAAGSLYGEAGEQKVAGTYTGEFDARPCNANLSECPG